MQHHAATDLRLLRATLAVGSSLRIGIEGEKQQKRKKEKKEKKSLPILSQMMVVEMGK
jgi:hypothetical protein